MSLSKKAILIIAASVVAVGAVGGTAYSIKTSSDKKAAESAESMSLYIQQSIRESISLSQSESASISEIESIEISKKESELLESASIEASIDDSIGDSRAESFQESMDNHFHSVFGDYYDKIKESKTSE